MQPEPPGAPGPERLVRDLLELVRLPELPQALGLGFERQPVRLLLWPLRPAFAVCDSA